jgi:acylphosphatase
VTQDERLTARVIGRVQGVGYRWWAMSVARQLALVGWVRNLDDEQSVELVAEGPSARLDEFEAMLARGPGSAHVDRVESSRGPAGGGLERFEVRP